MIFVIIKIDPGKPLVTHVTKLWERHESSITNHSVLFNTLNEMYSANLRNQQISDRSSAMLQLF